MTAAAGARRRRPATATGGVAALLALVLVVPVLCVTAGRAASVTLSAKRLTAGSLQLPPCYADAVRADAPVSYWRLDEASGTTAADAVGSSPGTYTGGPTLGAASARPGGANRSVTLNGTTGYVRVPYTAGLNPASSFTLEAWAYPTGGSGYRHLVGSSQSYSLSHAGYWMGLDPDGHWVAHASNGADNAATGPLARTGAWTHLAASYASGVLHLYVNGTEVATSSTPYTPAPSPTFLGIGAEYGDSSGPYSFWSGSLDEVAVYGTALSPGQVRGHYNSERCYRDEVQSDGPVAYWRLGESLGTVAQSPGTTYNGSYVGSPGLAATGALDHDSDTAVTFNGTTQYVSVPYAAALNPAQFTVEAWARPTGGAGTTRAVVASSSPTAGYWLGIGTDNQWRLSVGNGSGVSVVTGPAATPSTWTHLVASYNGTTAALYVDGLPAASATTGYAANTLRAFGIGAADAGSWGSALTGSVDEVAVYSSALSAARVRTHYLVGRSYRDTVLDDAPLSYWRLGEPSGTATTDVRGANPGTYLNSPTLGQPGAIAGDSDAAVSFDGTDDYADLGNNASLNLRGPFTLEAWIRVRSFTQPYQAILTKGDSSYRLQRGNTAPSLTFDTTSGGAYVVTSGSQAVDDGGWHHVVGVHDGTTQYLYLDGVLQSTSAVGLVDVVAYHLAIGENLEYRGVYWNGWIDEVAVYPAALSAAEVQLHYDSGRT